MFDAVAILLLYFLAFLTLITIHIDWWDLAFNSIKIKPEFNEPPIVKFAECMLVKRHTDNWIVGWIKHWHVSDR